MDEAGQGQGDRIVLVKFRGPTFESRMARGSIPGGRLRGNVRAKGKKSLGNVFCGLQRLVARVPDDQRGKTPRRSCGARGILRRHARRGGPSV